MRHQTYYVVAAVLVLATIPMYRYIFSRAREMDRPQMATTSQPTPLEHIQAPVTTFQPRPLLAGETCRNGFVYLTDRDDFRKARGYGGAPVPCQGDHVLVAGDASLAQPAAQVKTWYAYGERLPDGYKCSAADGPVYRTRIENGAATIEPLIRNGVIVHCGGDERSSHR